MESCNSISTYDKFNNLINYIEFQESQELKCYYNAVGSTLNKKYVKEFNAEGCKDMVNSIVHYEDPIMLVSLCVDGETAIRPVLSGESFTSIAPPNVSYRVDSYEDDEALTKSLQSFTIKSDLIDEWLNKL